MGMSTLDWSPAHHPSSSNGSTPAIGVALAIHGLNYRPQGMQPVVDCLNMSGYDCLVLSLHGHGDNYMPQPSMDEDARAFAPSRVSQANCGLTKPPQRTPWLAARADALGVPLVLSGFSLGALIGCALAATRPDVRVDRLLLFAPALALPPHGLLPWLAEYAPHWVLPSITPPRYRANRGTPGAGYAALYTGVAALQEADLQRLNVPTLVFLDRMDEAISCAGVESMAERIPKWNVHTLRKSDGKNGRVYHHLVIGEEAVGITAVARRNPAHFDLFGILRTVSSLIAGYF